MAKTLDQWFRDAPAAEDCDTRDYGTSEGARKRGGPRIQPKVQPSKPSAPKGPGSIARPSTPMSTRKAKMEAQRRTFIGTRDSRTIDEWFRDAPIVDQDFEKIDEGLTEMKKVMKQESKEEEHQTEDDFNTALNMTTDYGTSEGARKRRSGGASVFSKAAINRSKEKSYIPANPFSAKAINRGKAAENRRWQASRGHDALDYGTSEGARKRAHGGGGIRPLHMHQEGNPYPHSAETHRSLARYHFDTDPQGNYTHGMMRKKAGQMHIAAAKAIESKSPNARKLSNQAHSYAQQNRLR